MKNTNSIIYSKAKSCGTRYLTTMLFFLSVYVVLGQSVSATYSAGNISSYYDNSAPYFVDNTCNGSSTVLSVVLPAGGPWEVTGIDITYNIVSQNSAYRSEQRSLLFCQNNTTPENGGTWYNGTGSYSGTENFTRTNVSLANAIYPGGTSLDFEMWLDRTWGGSGCNSTYSYVANNSWTITVHYQAPPTCPDPSNLSVAGLTTDGATLIWDENGTATSWNFEIADAGVSPTGTPTYSQISTNPLVVNGLNADTDYDYYVQAYCGAADQSNWIGPFSFGTLISCPAPSSLSASGVTSNQATLSWTENGSASVWEIELGNAGFVPTGTPTNTEISTNPFVYSGLIPSTSYDFYVRAICGPGDTSAWVGPYNFTTTIIVGQVYVSATIGLANAIYPTVKGAFDKINDGTHQGDITVTIGANAGETITETTNAILNKSGVGSSNYNAVTLMPGASSIKVTGNITGSCCSPLTSAVIILNQANNVVIDGRIGGIGSLNDLIIENTSSGTYGGALTLVNASNNIIRYADLKSSFSTTSTTGGYGTLAFNDNNASGGDPGCDNNLVEFCHFSNAAGGYPTTAIASKGNVVANELHDSNVISNCQITNFNRFGVWLGTGSGDAGNRSWIIDGNEIYQTQAFSSMHGDQIGICIGSPFSTSYSEYGTFVISNNDIGGNGSGGKWIATSTLSRHVAGIAVSTWSSDIVNAGHTTIDGNVIHDFDVSTGVATTSSSDYGLFNGIVATRGRVRIGSSVGNTVGSLTDPGNIVLSRTTTSSFANASGIQVKSPMDLQNSINNNVISGIDLTVGSGNFIYFHGIKNSSATTYPQDSIYQNNVSFIKANKVNYFFGIWGQGVISKNRVRDIDFEGAATFSELVGIRWYGGEVTSADSRGIENNEIILGRNRGGASIATNDIIVGIEVTRGDADVYYNSVLIEGSSSGSENTVAIELPNSGTVQFINNLMYNERSGGTGNHYAVEKTGAGAGFISSNNAYVIGTNANNVFGKYSGADIADLTNWQSTTGEVNSISDFNNVQTTAITFPYLSQDSLDVTAPTWLTAGTPSVPLDDIAFRTRDVIVPTIGAYEPPPPVALPIEMIDFRGEQKSTFNELIWVTASEHNVSKFILERSENGVQWQFVSEVNSSGNSSNINNYISIDDEPYDVTYYRVKTYNLNGEFSISNTIVLRIMDSAFSSYPNPFGEYIIVELGIHNNVEIQLVNAVGQIVEKLDVHEGTSSIRLDTKDIISSGVYFLRLIKEAELVEQRIMVKF